MIEEALYHHKYFHVIKVFGGTMGKYHLLGWPFHSVKYQSNINENIYSWEKHNMCNVF